MVKISWKQKDLGKSNDSFSLFKQNSKLKFIEYFFPKYTELSLFLMSIAILLLIFINGELRLELTTFWNNFTDSDSALTILVIAIIFIFGLGLSIYHAFSKSTKSSFEKKAMLVFAAIVNVVSGMTAGLYLLNQASGLFIIFPVWNIINAVWLFILFRSGILNNDSISDENTSGLEIVAGTSILIVLIIFCNYLFQLHWSITFSIAITYGAFAGNFIKNITPNQTRENFSSQN